MPLTQVSSDVLKTLPGWTYWIDTANSNRTTIASFVKNSVQGHVVSYGDLPYFQYVNAWSFMYQMNIYSPGTQIVTQVTSQIDDTFRFFISGGTGSSTVTPASATASNSTITWTLTAGINLLTIIHNNNGGGGAFGSIFGQFLITSPTLKYVAP